MAGIAYTGLTPTDVRRRLDPALRFRLVSRHDLSPCGKDTRPLALPLMRPHDGHPLAVQRAVACAVQGRPVSAYGELLTRLLPCPYVEIEASVHQPVQPQTPCVPEPSRHLVSLVIVLGSCVPIWTHEGSR